MNRLLTPLRVDKDRWPDVANVPRTLVRAAIARALVRSSARRLPIRVSLPGGEMLGDKPQAPVLYLHRPGEFFRRLGAGGLIGFGESYQAGDWDADDLPRLIEVLASHVQTLVPAPFQWLRRLHAAPPPRADAPTLTNSARNIHRHYDLSNELFASFLDETLTYSSALFEGTAPTQPNLAGAQRCKIDRLLDLTGVGPGVRVLEIGTGWGELAIRAAKRGATVHTVTLSRRQKAAAQARAADAGVAHLVDVRLCDYRQIEGPAAYDAVLSVEMIEAVGQKYWPVYFATLGRLLAPGGRVGLQTITMAHHRMLATRHTHTWIQKYIFPGGLIPSVEVIEKQSGFRLLDRLDFGQDYAHTLRLWRDRFRARTATVAQLGFDEIFRRTWELYLAYSQAGFASGYLNVHQFIMEAR